VLDLLRNEELNQHEAIMAGLEDGRRDSPWTKDDLFQKVIPFGKAQAQQRMERNRDIWSLTFQSAWYRSW